MQAICSFTMKIMLFSQRFLGKINCFTKRLSTILEPLSISLISKSNRKKPEDTKKRPVDTFCT